jgi:hypothetical protein
MPTEYTPLDKEGEESSSDDNSDSGSVLVRSEDTLIYVCR